MKTKKVFPNTIEGIITINKNLEKSENNNQSVDKPLISSEEENSQSCLNLGKKKESHQEFKQDEKDYLLQINRNEEIEQLTLTQNVEENYEKFIMTFQKKLMKMVKPIKKNNKQYSQQSQNQEETIQCYEQFEKIDPQQFQIIQNQNDEENKNYFILQNSFVLKQNKDKNKILFCNLRNLEYKKIDLEDSNLDLIFAAANPFSQEKCFLGFQNGEIYELDLFSSVPVLKKQMPKEAKQVSKMQLLLDKYLIFYEQDYEEIRIFKMKITQIDGKDEDHMDSNQNQNKSKFRNKNIAQNGPIIELQKKDDELFEPIFSQIFNSKIANILIKEENDNQIIIFAEKENNINSQIVYFKNQNLKNIKDQNYKDYNELTYWNKFENQVSQKFSVQNKFLFTISSDQKGLTIYDSNKLRGENELRDEPEQFEQLKDIHNSISDFEYSSKQDALITLGNDVQGDNFIKIFRNFLKTSQREPQNYPQQQLFQKVKLSKDQNMIATSAENFISIWSIKTQLIKLCNLPILSTFNVKELGFLEMDNYLYSQAQEGDFVFWKISETLSNLKKVVQKMKFAIIDDQHNLLTYSEKEIGGKLGQVILWKGKNEGNTKNDSDNKDSSLENIMDLQDKNSQEEQRFHDLIEEDKKGTETDDQCICYTDKYFFYKSTDKQICSIAKNKQDQLFKFDECEGNITHINSYQSFLFVMYVVKDKFKIKIFDTSKQKENHISLLNIENKISENFEELYKDKTGFNYFDFQGNSQVKFSPNFSLTNKGKVLVVQNSHNSVQIYYFFDDKYNDYCNTDKLINFKEFEVSRIQSFQINQNGSLIALFNNNKLIIIKKKKIENQMLKIFGLQLQRQINLQSNKEQPLFNEQDFKNLKYDNDNQQKEERKFSVLDPMAKSFLNSREKILQNNIKETLDIFKSDDKFSIKQGQEYKIYFIDCQEKESILINIEEKWLIYQPINSQYLLQKVLSGYYKIIYNNLDQIKWFTNDKNQFISLQDFINNTEESFKKETHISGLLNNLVPAVINEMKNNFKDQKVSQEYIKFLDDNSIEDFNINIFNYAAYSNKIEMSQQCLLANIKFQRDYFGKTPLGYFLENKSCEGVDQILQYVCDNKKYEVIGDLQKEEITQLFELSPSKLDSFLTASLELQEYQQEQGFILGGFMCKKYKDQNYFLANTICKEVTTLQDKYYEFDDLNSQNDKPIQLQALLFRYNFQIGTRESKEFHEAVASTEDLIFKNETIQKIIDYKWEQVIHIAYLELGMTIIYIIIFQIYTFKIGNLQGCENALICIFVFYAEKYVLITLFFIIENLHVIIKGKPDLKHNFNKLLKFKFWDIVDIVFTCFYLTYLATALGNKKGIMDQKYLISFLNFFSWLKLISTFRVFESTRMFLQMIIDIFLHLFDFYVFLIFVILTFATTFTFLMMENGFDDHQNFNNYAFILYEYIFQQFPTALMPQYMSPVQPANYTQALPVTLPLADENSYYLLAFHLCAQMIISLIMMNLIIGLINDALQISLSNKVQSKYRGTNDMILYCETFSVSLNKDKQHLHILSYKKSEQQDEDKAWKTRTTDTLEFIKTELIQAITDQSKKLQPQLTKTDSEDFKEFQQEIIYLKANSEESKMLQQNLLKATEESQNLQNKLFDVYAAEFKKINNKLKVSAEESQRIHSELKKVNTEILKMNEMSDAQFV